MSTWHKGPSGNYRLRGKGFAISFRSVASLSDVDTIDLALSSCMVGMDLNVPTEGETALCIETDHTNPYWILKGDHRKQYEPLVQRGLHACYRYWQHNRRLAVTRSARPLSRSEMRKLFGRTKEQAS